MPEPLYDDPVVAEIHAIRAKMLADCGGDHRKLMEQVRARERASDRQVIPAPPPPQHRTKAPSGAAVDAIAHGQSSPTAG
jgi:hypothetical protein